MNNLFGIAQFVRCFFEQYLNSVSCLNNNHWDTSYPTWVKSLKTASICAFNSFKHTIAQPTDSAMVPEYEHIVIQIKLITDIYNILQFQAKSIVGRTENKLQLCTVGLRVCTQLHEK